MLSGDFPRGRRFGSWRFVAYFPEPEKPRAVARRDQVPRSRARAALAALARAVLAAAARAASVDSARRSPHVARAMPRLESYRRAPARRPSLARGRAPLRRASSALLALALSAALACSGKSEAQPGPPPPVEVGVVTLQAQPVRLTTELPGRTLAFETSEVRPQVSGIIRARLFTEGQQVEKGQTLYQIDARLYRAAAAQARANLASARAQHEAAQARADRFAELVREQVVSEQDYADATASARQAAAAIEQAQAALETATINLRFTEVPAPISGRIGRSLVTTGALVTAGQANALATIQRLDPMFVD